MKLKFLKVAIVVLILSVSSLANAEFIDLDTSTLDQTTNLEWLDVTQTTGRSYLDVFADINDTQEQTTNVFSLDAQWRYATEDEFRHLIVNWFGFPFDSGIIYLESTSLGSDSVLVESFIKTFGDTYQQYSDQVLLTNTTNENSAGYTIGILSDSPEPHEHLMATVYDGEVFHRDTGKFINDYNEYIAAQGTRADYATYPFYIGSWLVRDNVSVPEPSTLAIFILGIIGLVSRKFKQ